MGVGAGRRRALPAALAVIGLVLVFVGAPLSAAVAPLQRPYLALGDSITFGYVARPAPDLDGSDPFADATAFVGYPTYVGAALGLQTVNAACPGESSTSMLTLGAPDAGCAGYRGAYPLHVADTGLTQLQFADAFLRSNPATQLVTVAIGINDMLLAIARCGGPASTACIQRDLPATLAVLRANLTAIVATLRTNAPHVAIVLVNYFTLEYANAETVGYVRALDSTIARVGAAEHLRVADTFDAVMEATEATGGDACTSGLFGSGPSTLGPCDLHPNAAGQRVLARAVVRAVRAAGAAA